ncbi:MAG: TolC family protein [Sphingosinicella sp.]|nr:TolC family protein [Sphingosinicella sp.]
MARSLPAALGLLVLTACTTVGPDYKSPEPAAPAQTGFIGAFSPTFIAQEPPGRWWSLFQDPLLDSLIEQALQANTDLRVAAANLAQARAVLREVRAGRLPSTNLGGSATYGRSPGGDDGALFDAGLDVGYQLDLFGRIRRATEAGRADFGAVQAAYDVTRISVAAETARAYADACSFGRQLNVARESVRIQEETFDLTRRQFEGGRGTELETGQATALLEQTRAVVPTLEAQRRAALYRLAVLTGRPPAEFPAAVQACTTPPDVARPIPVGDGATLLARRPDVRGAERELAAATARIGVATAELYPDIRLGLSAGSTASSLDGLFSDSGFRYSLGPLISWTFPNTAVARSRIAQAEAGQQAALARFDGTWLRALEETETALARYVGELERVAALRRARAGGAEAARVARLRHRAGRESFQIVLDAERSLAQVDQALAQAEAQLSNALVSVFLALGGGWQEPAAAAAG